MSESQKHGFDFERIFLRQNFNDIFRVFEKNISYTNVWDFPPVSVKTFRFDGKNPTIEFGSIERTFNNKEAFILCLVGYDQQGTSKIPVFSDILFLQKKDIIKLKGGLDLNTIQKMNDTLKLFGEGYHNEARIWAKQEKLKNNHKTNYDIRFKIDSKKQRRIQCALKLEDLYLVTKNYLDIKNHYNIPVIESKQRKRN